MFGLPKASGSYCLIAFLPEACTIQFGKNTAFFPRGWYAYVGSAMKGLEKRMARHARQEKKKHWHIDFFLEKARVCALLAMPSPRREECEKSKALEKIGGIVVAEKFGSTDCRCKTHLYFFAQPPMMMEDFRRALGIPMGSKVAQPTPSWWMPKGAILRARPLIWRGLLRTEIPHTS